ncbi:MMPL family transporter [Actinomadura sp. 3N508]|uniref:MMPL family transporter n=1 Tax=Actinomadura sp. 3N508 TaxID=3375153 RepID=UPI0037A837F7
MFERLGRWVHRHRRLVLGCALGAVVFAGVWGTRVFPALAGGGFDAPHSDSVRAAQAIEDRLGRDDADVLVLYRSDRVTVDDPGFRSAVVSAVGALPPDAVQRAVTYWNSGSADLVSADRRATYAAITLRGDEERREDEFERIEAGLRVPGLDTQIGGLEAIDRDINDQVAEDIARSELLSAPVLLVLLVLIFRGLVSAALPLVIGAAAILGAFSALHALTYVTSVSVYSVQIVTILGLGLAIDYALFMVSRFREELGRGLPVEEAVARTSATAGRTIAVSGVTVGISLSGLLIFPEGFLRSMGFGGLAAVLIAVLAAVVVLPALLGTLGHRVDALAVRLPFAARRGTGRGGGARKAGAGAGDGGEAGGPAGDGARDGIEDGTRGGIQDGRWYRLARAVMRRPVLFAVAITAVLIALGLPFLRVEFGGVDYRALPASTESRQVAERIVRDFGGGADSPIQVVVRLAGDATAPAGKAALAAYTASIAGLPDVREAEVSGAAGDTARITVEYRSDQPSVHSRDLVRQVRAVEPPPGAEVLVGGKPAEVADMLDDLGARLPWMLLIIAGVTFVLLFLAFGAPLLPLKALALNVVSLGASFGAVVWIFQDGHLSGLLDFTATGTLDATQPILVLAIVFGLSMDYEVFLLSRIRERYAATGDPEDAVATGLQHTGRIITGAALLLIVVIAAFSASGIAFVKLIGIAMIIAVLLDATVVRALLVPATMRLLGRAAWWTPRRLRRVRLPVEDASPPAALSSAACSADETSAAPPTPAAPTPAAPTPAAPPPAPSRNANP